MSETTTIGSRVIKPCQQCKKTFESYRRQESIFCSKQCVYDSKKGIPFIAKKGKDVPCESCGKLVYKPLSSLRRSKNYFCSPGCQIDFQSRNKILFECVICEKQFAKSKSEVEKAIGRNHEILYCSLDCRNNDKKRMSQKAHHANKKRVEKYGLTSFEKAGSKWLSSLKFLKGVDYNEQVLLFDQVSVDIYFPNEKVVVQFDGTYWHTKPARIEIDRSQDEFLTSQGIKVFRISDTAVKELGFEEFNNELKKLIYG